MKSLFETGFFSARRSFEVQNPTLFKGADWPSGQARE
jgi:hypothetical protein